MKRKTKMTALSLAFVASGIIASSAAKVNVANSNGMMAFNSATKAKAKSAQIANLAISPSPEISTDSGKRVNSGDFVNEGVTVKRTGEILHLRKPDGSIVSVGGQPSLKVEKGGQNGCYECWSTDSSGGSKSEILKFYLDTVCPTGGVYQKGTRLLKNGAQLYDSFSYKATDTGSGIKACYVRKPNSNSFVGYAAGNLFHDTDPEGWYYFYSVDNAGNKSETSMLYLVSNGGRLTYQRSGFASNTISIDGTSELQEKKIYVSEGTTMTFSLEEAEFDDDSDIKSGKVIFTGSNFPNSIYYIKGTGRMHGNRFKIAVVIVRELPKVRIGAKEYLNGSTTHFKQDQTASVITSALFGEESIYSVTLYMSGNTSGTQGVNGKSVELKTADGTETTYRIRIVDLAHNVSNITFTIDKKAPLATWRKGDVAIGNGSSVNEPISLVYEETGVKAKLYKDGSFMGSYSSSSVISEDGEYRIVLTDIAGNVSNYTASIDTQAPKGTIYADDVEVGTGTFTSKNVRFEWEENTATCLLNGNPYKMNSPIKDEGKYTFVLKDTVGNESTYEITIDRTAPKENMDHVESKNDMPISKFYQVEFDKEKHSFRTYEEALGFAKAMEKEKYVAELVLNDIKDFTQGHLVADNGDPNDHADEVRVGNYWRYKSQANPSIELYYFDSRLLDRVIGFYASKYVKGPSYHNGKSTPDYGNKSDSMLDSTWGEDGKRAKIGNGTILAKKDSDSAVARLDGANNDISLSYGIPLGDQLIESGLYTITETDLAGNSSSYPVYIDHEAPKLKATVSVMGEEKEREITIDEGSLDGIKSYFYKSFKIEEILDGDDWALISVDDGKKTSYYSKEDALPILSEGGKYVVSAYDRLGNSYSFNVYIVGSPAEISFSENKEKTFLDISIKLEQDFDTIVSLEITRDGKKLDGVSGDKLSYRFDKGGLYKVVLKDNFGRVISKEYDFQKAKPSGTLTGVSDGGRTSGHVSFLYDKERFHAEVSKDGVSSSDSTGILRFEDDGHYSIKLIRNDDPESYETYSFEIDKAAPSIKLDGATDGQRTNSDVKVHWDDLDVEHAYVSFNGGEKAEFDNGTTFKDEGSYEITLIDSLGNRSVSSFVIDRTLDYSVKTDDGKDLVGTDRTTKDVIVCALEEGMEIKVSKDGENIPYSFGEKLQDEGTYVIRITDSLGNVKSFTIVIDRSVDASISAMDGAITNDDVDIFANEEVEVTVTKDGEAYSYEQGQDLTEEGHYRVVLKDKLGNVKEYDFCIVKSPKKSVDYELGDGVEIIEVKKNGKVIPHEGNGLDFEEDGTYEVTVNKDGKTQAFTIVLDTTAPTIGLEGVEDGGSVDGKVTISSMSEEGTMVVKKDGVVIDYKLGDELSEYGHYEITVTDLLGNSRTYSFDLAFRMNGWSIALIVVASLTLVGGVAAVIANRKRIFKKRK